MALKLSKCRLCLKLGDFYSIFTEDDGLQLAEMAMGISHIKIVQGDGLPDKVCTECIAKLSSAHIFKLQCERSDQELRRNYITQPGVPPTLAPVNRQSSDSGFSNKTDLSTKVPTDNTRVNKRKHNKNDNTQILEKFITSSPAPSNESFETASKRARLDGDAGSYSDFDDNTETHFSDSDSDDPLVNENNKCFTCNKVFPSNKELIEHNKTEHLDKNKNTKATNLESIAKGLIANAVVRITKIDQSPPNKEIVDPELCCKKCNRSFKLKIMLKQHTELCPAYTPTQIKEESNTKTAAKQKHQCNICFRNFARRCNLCNHMKFTHGHVLNDTTDQQLHENSDGSLEPSDSEEQEVEQTTHEVPIVDVEVTKSSGVPCVFCHTLQYSYAEYANHFDNCDKSKKMSAYVCKPCRLPYGAKWTLLKHMKEVHYADGTTHECRICSKTFASQDLLVKHLAAHMSNMDESQLNNCDDSGPSTFEDTSSIASELTNDKKCPYCDKVFTYKKSLQSHIKKHGTQPTVSAPVTPHLKEEPLDYDEDPPGSDSATEIDDLTCDICEKTFSYRRILIHHKKTKHNIGSGHKRSKILYKDCTVTCLICEVTFGALDSLKHNKTHLQQNLKPRNKYQCVCGEQYKSSNAMRNHITLVHRLNRTMPEREINAAEFCEVVVTKTEPSDAQNGDESGAQGLALDGGKPMVNLSGFDCHICGKKMETLRSLRHHINWHAHRGRAMQTEISCSICNQMFKFKSHYRLHMREHYKDTNIDPQLLTCKICNRKSKHLRALQAHMNWHKQTRFSSTEFKCAICKREFPHRKVYLIHMAKHYKYGENAEQLEKTMNGTQAEEINTVDNKCTKCDKVCDSEDSLKRHMSWHMSKTALYGSRYDCTYCEKQFTNKTLHMKHERQHFEDDDGPLKCHICGKGFTSDVHYKRHVKSHNFDKALATLKKRNTEKKLKKVKCPICSRHYPDLVKLIGHLKYAHPNSKMIKPDPDAPASSTYHCEVCAKAFLTERHLKRHQLRHKFQNHFIKCKFCGKNSYSMKHHNIHIKSHLTKRYRETPIKCLHCEETFTYGYDLHNHIKQIHEINEKWIADRGPRILDGPLKQYQCSICFKILASKGNYERHIDYHNTLRCNYCFEHFSTKAFLDGHVNFGCEKQKLIGHTDTYLKKLKCNVCYKAFSLQIKLDCHLSCQHKIDVTKQASDSKMKTVCDYCFQVFEDEDSLTSHKLYHRTIGYFGCLYCKSKFNTITMFNKHKNHHFAMLCVDDPIKCEHCDDRFTEFRQFIYHMRDVHNDNKDWLVMPKKVTSEECKICKKVMFNLPRHMDYHEQNRCKKCGEYFFSTTACDEHLCTIDSDDEETPVNIGVKDAYEECTFCFKPLKKKKKLHDIIHSGSGAISCRLCSYKFKTMDAFNIHSFSHRSRKYTKKQLKCPKCGCKFIRYGPFIKHMHEQHKVKFKLHYRANVVPETCVICKENYPNLHNHYRAHIQHQCQNCYKYFTSNKVYLAHQCDKEDAEPDKVFQSDVDLNQLINEFVPKDLDDCVNYYADTDDEVDPDVKEPSSVLEMKQPVITGVHSLNVNEMIDKSINGSDETEVSRNSLPALNNPSAKAVKSETLKKSPSSECDANKSSITSTKVSCTPSKDLTKHANKSPTKKTKKSNSPTTVISGSKNIIDIICIDDSDDE